MSDILHEINTDQLLLLLQLGHVDARREEKDTMKVNPHVKIYYKGVIFFFQTLNQCFLYFLFPSPEVFNGCLSAQSMAFIASESRYRTERFFISLSVYELTFLIHCKTLIMKSRFVKEQDCFVNPQSFSLQLKVWAWFP